jgi:hypothetical protein
VPSTQSWQYQLQGKIDTSVDARVFDVDGADVSAATVKRLHQLGRRVICYVDVGTWENWRADAAKFPKRVLGRAVSGWPGERWLDIRARSELEPIIRKRMSRCRDKGFDAVEGDNVNAFENDTGFPISAGDQLAYNRWFANEAHSLGLAAVLKNDLDQAKPLLPYFDLAVLEQCFQYGECGKAQRFVAAGKAVFDVEYSVTRDRFCGRAQQRHVAAIRKRLDLKVWRRACPS